jgi:universal stress protein E
MNPIRSILVIVDPTAETHPAIEKATELAAKLAARIDLFACDTKASSNIRHAQFAANPGGRALVTDLRPYLEALAEPLRKRGIEVTTEAVCADPVMGAVSRSAMKRVFIGSTAEIVLERMPCDVLVVKGPNFAELLPF